jgi:TipAS antibiotic-recognition domain
MGEVQRAIQQGKPAAVLLPRMIETIPRQNDAHWMMNYYSPTAQGKIAERAASFTPERPARRSEAGKEYYRDLAALKEQDDPEGAKAAELSKRYEELLAAFTGNDPDIEAGLTALYRDRENWPAERKDRLSEYEDATVD